MNVIKTYDKNGKQNGRLIPLWHVDHGLKVDQVYLTTIFPGMVKGPHLHEKRRGLFYCVRGEVTVVIRTEGYIVTTLRLGDPPVLVPPRIPAAFYNFGFDEAMLLNMPSPPWREGDDDEHEVPDWDWQL